MKKYERVIFLDADDTARAPMAAKIMQRQELLKEMKIFSRGLVVLFPEPVNPKAEAILVSQGLTAKDHTAKQLEQEEITAKTLILTMEDSQKDRVWSTYSDAGNVYTLAEYVGAKGDILPLFGEPLSSYGRCFEVLELLLQALTARLNEDELQK